jgi:hypothetical protein
MSRSTDSSLSDPGDLFEERFWALLRRKYRPEELFKLPATLGGDYGIEGFSTDGIAYQCYADRDSPTLQNRTDKQKQKLYRDLQKLKTNAADLTAVLGGLAIQHYFLVVPTFHSSDLVGYAVQQSLIVRTWGLPFIHSDFSVHIKTPNDYPGEMAAALRDDAVKAIVPTPVVDEAELTLFPTDKPELVRVLDSKIEVLGGAASAEARIRLRDYFIRAFLAKEKVMSALLEWPEMWETVERRRQSRQEWLELESQLSSEPPNDRVLALLDGYASDLTSNVGGLVDEDARRIALGQVGEWLMRCPLSFGAQA